MPANQENSLDTILRSGLSASAELGGADLEMHFPGMAGEGAEVPAMVDPFAQVEQLELDHLINEVLRVNPTLEAAEAGWQAATELYDQATAFHDPQFRFLQGPTLFGPSDGSHMWRIQFQQRVPWFGKRGLMGDAVLAEADAEEQEIVAARLLLIQGTKSAFYDYQTVGILLGLLEAERQLVNERLRRVHQQAPDDLTAQVQLRQAQMDLFQLNRQQEQLVRAERLARGGINLLLHRQPDHPLPRARHQWTFQELLPDHTLREQAIFQRPDLSAAKARLRSQEAVLGLAYKDFYPDLEFVSRTDSTWDSFWLPSDANMRPQLGVHLYVPIQVGRRRAAVRQGHAELRKRRAELDQLVGKIHYEVQAAYERAEETRRTLAMFPGMLKACQQKIYALEQLAYNDPKYQKDLESARRELLKCRVQECETWRDYQQRLSELEQAAGGPVARPSP